MVQNSLHRRRHETRNVLQGKSVEQPFLEHAFFPSTLMHHPQKYAVYSVYGNTHHPWPNASTDAAVYMALISVN